MSQVPHSTSMHSAEAAAAALQQMATALPDSRVLPRTTRTSHAMRPARAQATRSRRLARYTSGLRLNMTPLIDVVFNLLIFFIATTRLAPAEDVLRMDLPPRMAQAGSAAPAPAPSAQGDPFAYLEDALRIEVQAGGALRAGAPVQAARSVGQLRGLLQDVRRDASNPKGLLPPDFPIVIAPARGALWQDAVEALNAAAAAGYTNVNFEPSVTAAAGGKP